MFNEDIARRRWITNQYRLAMSFLLCPDIRIIAILYNEAVARIRPLCRY